MVELNFPKEYRSFLTNPDNFQTGGFRGIRGSVIYVSKISFLTTLCLFVPRNILF